MTELLIRQLEQLEAHGQLLVASIRTLRMSLHQADVDENGKCLHPSRKSVPAMGQPGRFRCTRCGAFGGFKEQRHQ